MSSSSSFASAPSSSSKTSLNLAQYADDILLEIPFQPELNNVEGHWDPSKYSSTELIEHPVTYSYLLQSLTEYFHYNYRQQHKAHKHDHHHHHEQGGDSHDKEEDDEDEQEEELDDEMPDGQRRSLLRSLLCIRPPLPIRDDIQKQLDTLLHLEQRKEEFTAVTDIPSVAQQFSSGGALKDVSSKISLWRGDITTLSADCIVNAANSALLGCFQPSHVCIDNIIHAAAGPRLRLDCASIMRKQQKQEPIGKCKVTRGYHLPARFVLHTVGPQIEDGRTQETDSERKQLSACYASCLDAAAQLKNVRSVAFCCISTGLFGFPAVSAANIAVQTVSEWLRNQNSKQVSQIERVIFNVFKESDEKIYTEIFTKLTGAQISSASVSTVPKFPPRVAANLAKAADWLGSADAVLIAGAAGLSASCGLDYTSEEVFKRLFPAMHRRGFRRMYEFIGFRDWTPALRWGYLLSQVNLARFNWLKENSCEIYGTLLKIFKNFGDNAFVLTTNADGLFGQTGFDLDRVYTAQGDYGLMQCMKPCAPDSLWPIKPFIDAALPYIDKNTQEITNASVIPACKRCGGEVMMNVRGGSWFLENHLMPKRTKYLEWLKGLLKANKKVVVLEIGVGFNTAGVIRYPMEDLTEKNSNVRLIRINQHQPQVPKHLSGERALAIDIDATEAVRVIAQPMLQRIQNASVQSEGAVKADELTDVERK